MTITFTADLSDLAAQLTGPVFTPGTPGYDDECAGFNVAHRPRPAVVVAAIDADDVSAAVRWAATAGLRVCVQATGHGLVNDLADTLLVSTRRLTSLQVDPDRRTARVGAGVRWRAVIDAAAPYGLAPLNGSSSNVGVVGYTLGGGLGPMSRQFGFAADHVRSMTVVTADGKIRRVDADHDADLFWALRGGKIGFGVVTEIELDLVEVTRFYGGGLFFPGADAAAVLHAWRTWAPTLPNEVTTSVALLRLPPDPQLPPPLRGQFVAQLRYAHLGDAVEAERMIEPMRRVAPVLVDTLGELPYAAVDAVHMDPVSPMPCYDRGLLLNGLPADAVDGLIALAGAQSDSALALVELRLLGGAIAAEPQVPSAVAGRDAEFAVYVLGVPAGPAGSLVVGQVDAVVDALAPWRSGALLNFLGHAQPDELRAVWSDAARTRLAEVAVRYDERNVFGGQHVFA